MQQSNQQILFDSVEDILPHVLDSVATGFRFVNDSLYKEPSDGQADDLATADNEDAQHAAGQTMPEEALLTDEASVKSGHSKDEFSQSSEGGRIDAPVKKLSQFQKAVLLGRRLARSKAAALNQPPPLPPKVTKIHPDAQTIECGCLDQGDKAANDNDFLEYSDDIDSYVSASLKKLFLTNEAVKEEDPLALKLDDLIPDIKGLMNLWIQERIDGTDAPRSPFDSEEWYEEFKIRKGAVWEGCAKPDLSDLIDNFQNKSCHFDIDEHQKTFGLCSINTEVRENTSKTVFPGKSDIDTVLEGCQRPAFTEVLSSHLCFARNVGRDARTETASQSTPEDVGQVQPCAFTTQLVDGEEKQNMDSRDIFIDENNKRSNLSECDRQDAECNSGTKDLMQEACFKDEKTVRLKGHQQMKAKRNPEVPGVPAYFLTAKRSDRSRSKARSRSRSRSRSRPRPAAVLLSYE